MNIIRIRLSKNTPVVLIILIFSISIEFVVTELIVFVEFSFFSKFYSVRGVFRI
jgi:hypothetical protein